MSTSADAIHARIRFLISGPELLNLNSGSSRYFFLSLFLRTFAKHRRIARESWTIRAAMTKKGEAFFVKPRSYCHTYEDICGCLCREGADDGFFSSCRDLAPAQDSTRLEKVHGKSSFTPASGRDDRYAIHPGEITVIGCKIIDCIMHTACCMKCIREEEAMPARLGERLIQHN
jgi:hypothetical protein